MQSSKCFPIGDEEILSTEEAAVEKPAALSTYWMQKEKSYCGSFSFQESGVVLQLEESVWSR